MIVRERERQDRARDEGRPVPYRPDGGARRAEDRDFGRVDDRSEIGSADPPEARDRKRAALHVGKAELTVARLAGQGRRLLRDLHDAFLVDVADDRDDQPPRRIRRKSEVIVLLEDDLFAVERCVEVGKRRSAATDALSRNASIVTFASLFSALSCLRNASRSVTSASSCCVTCGIMTQLRARLGPESFAMRVSGLRSTVPNCAKSTAGHGRSFNPPAGAPLAPGAGPSVNARLMNPCTSSRVTRPLGPVPETRPKSTPSSRAKRRIAGLACVLAPPVLAGGGAAAGGVDGAAGAAAAPAAWAAAIAAPAGITSFEVTPPSVTTGLTSRVTIGVPAETLSPTRTLTSRTTPEVVAGTSIVAFSDSSSTSGVSTRMSSPGFTRTSMTGTSLKLPMSGTATSTMVARSTGLGAARPAPLRGSRSVIR